MGDVNIDLSQFHDVFFDECSEGIEVMERELLNLDVGEPDNEVINTIFRAAHSIKGSAGTFGFAEISEFTHEMETVLDGMRDGSIDFTDSAKQTLLSSVDCLTGMIDASKSSKPIDTDSVAELQQKLSAISSGEKTETVKEEKTAAEPKEEIQEEEEAKGATWKVSFFPHENIFFTGNDPFRLIRELTTLGRLDAISNVSKIPDLADMNPENCYLGWDMTLYGHITEEEIKDIFAWVEDDCDLDIKVEEDRRQSTDRRASSGEPMPGRRKTDLPVTAKRESSSIRVSTDKVDDLLNLVGEMVITQSILSRMSMDLNINSEKFTNCLTQLERNTRELQEQTMGIRMLPIDFAFQRLPRMVHDLSGTLGKKIELSISGESTELDKTVLEKIGDPLLHLARNSLDHGIEPPDIRIQAGKPETGTISVSAYHAGGSIVVEIADDGAGINTDKVLNIAKEKGLVGKDEQLTNHEIHELIFKPGFSTSDSITDVSGRGVGMDVVRRNITDLGGTVELESEYGVGSKFIIRLPLTLAILDGQMVIVGEQTFIIPIHSIVETIQVNDENLNAIAGKDEVYEYRGDYIPIVRLKEIFNFTETDDSDDLLVIVDIGGKHLGVCVDNVIGQQQVVIKNLETNYKQVKGIAGATVLGDGSVALILDVLGMSREVSHINTNKKSSISSSEQVVH